MIFLILFGFIAIIVIGLNLYDSSNLEKIQQHLQNKDCQNIVYAKGSYKAICRDKIVQIENAFSINLDEKDEIEISKIKNIKLKGLNLYIDDRYELQFKEEKNIDKFYKKIEEMRNR